MTRNTMSRIRCVLLAASMWEAMSLTSNSAAYAQVNYLSGSVTDYAAFSLYGNNFESPGSPGVVSIGTLSAPINYAPALQSMPYNESGYVGTLTLGNQGLTGPGLFNASNSGISIAAYGLATDTAPQEDLGFDRDIELADSVTFTVSSVTNFVINAVGQSQDTGGDYFAATINLSGGKLSDAIGGGYYTDSYAPIPSLSDAGQLLPGVTYKLNTSIGGPDQTSYTAYLTLNLALSTPSAHGSGPVLTQAGSFSSKQASVPNTVNGYGGVAASTTSTKSNGVTLTVSFDDNLSGQDFGSAGSPLFQTAAAPTFLLPESGGFTEAWDVSPSTALTGTTTLKFDFDPGALAPGTNLSSLEIFHYVNGQWVLPAGETVNTVSDTITVPVTSFSPFALGVAAVPEPGSTSLLLAGVLCLGRMRRRAAHCGQ